MFVPAINPGVAVPVPPFATDSGKVKLAPMGLQVFVEVQELRLLPACAELLKNNCPTTQVEGNAVPTLTGRVTGIVEKSGFLDCVLRFTMVFVWPETTETTQASEKIK
jgi:hypothetical protein